MKSTGLFTLFVTTTLLLACGQSEEAAPPASVMDAPQQIAPAPAESVAVEPAPAESVVVEPVPSAASSVPAQAPVTPPATPKLQPRAAKPAAPAIPPPQASAAPSQEALPSAPNPDLARGQQVYRQSCAVCHDKGVAGAPRTGDTASWSPRLALGMDVLYKTALLGKGAMPAKGGNPSLTDHDVKAAVDYMAAQSR
ncbi:MAG TPA: c-type cytochrome [Thiobacillus sp.]